MTAGLFPGGLSANAGIQPPANATAITWDAENRLISFTISSVTHSYTYDYLSRLTTRLTSNVVNQRYGYDGWNRIVQYDGGATLQDTFTWGLDLSGSMQGAGGVGGLLATRWVVDTINNTDYFPAYDGNGNVTQYIRTNGTIASHYEYDPFGTLTRRTGTPNNRLQYRFSTKPRDTISGLYYYGYRWYDPLTGRWPSRDPIEESGGVNFYATVGNDSVNTYDYLGREDAKKKVAKYTLNWKTVEIKMGNCGHFKWTIEWSVKGENAKGMIFQEVVKVADIKNCANPPQGNGPKQLGGLVFEAWNWPAAKGGGKDTWSMQDAVTAHGGQLCQGEYAVKGSAYFTKSKLNTKPAQKPQLPHGVTWADLGMPLLDEGFSMADYQVTPDVDPATGAQRVNATKDSNTVARMIRVKWNCCNGKAKTQLVNRTPDPK
jgi:RHS repeat-associated protein